VGSGKGLLRWAERLRAWLPLCSVLPPLPASLPLVSVFLSSCSKLLSPSPFPISPGSPLPVQGGDLLCRKQGPFHPGVPVPEPTCSIWLIQRTCSDTEPDRWTEKRGMKDYRGLWASCLPGWAWNGHRPSSRPVLAALVSRWNPAQPRDSPHCGQARETWEGCGQWVPSRTGGSLGSLEILGGVTPTKPMDTDASCTNAKDGRCTPRTFPCMTTTARCPSAGAAQPLLYLYYLTNLKNSLLSGGMMSCDFLTFLFRTSLGEEPGPEFHPAQDRGGGCSPMLTPATPASVE
jgi:hypothetical protein